MTVQTQLFPNVLGALLLCTPPGVYLSALMLLVSYLKTVECIVTVDAY